jgi:hypothetical protein
VQALAVLRRGERDLGAGPFLALLRSDAEKALALDSAHDETWIPKFPVRVISVLFSFILFAFCLSKILSSPERERKGFRLFAGILVLGIFTGIAGIALTGNTVSEEGKTALLEGGRAYQIPDISAALSAEFREAQPVRIRERAGEWVYAESYDGLSGWVPAEQVIPY